MNEDLQTRISTLVERAPQMSGDRFAEEALPLLMQANEALADASLFLQRLDAIDERLALIAAAVDAGPHLPPSC